MPSQNLIHTLTFTAPGAHEPAVASAPPPRCPLAAGTPLNQGDYVVESVAGGGGFGVTYRCHSRAQGRTVAVKEFYPAGCERHDGALRPATLTVAAFDTARRRFAENAGRFLQLRHPHLVPVLDIFEERGTAYMAMEFLNGSNLLEVIETTGAFPLPRALEIVQQVGDALHAVHRLGLLHGDVKPDNIALVAGPGGISRAVLFDFDLTTRIEHAAGYRTRPLTDPVQCGTPGYAALELYGSATPVGPASDIYALGATLCHLMCGVAPAAAPDRALGLGLPRLPALPSVVGEALAWSLEIAAPQRPQTVPDFLEALEGRAGITTAAAVAMSPATVRPVAAPADDNDWLVLRLRDLAIDWPEVCACCAEAATTHHTVRAGVHRLEVPYCLRCMRHVDLSRRAGVVTAVGMVVGLAIASVGVIMSDLFLGPLGVGIHFSAMAYGVLRFIGAEALARGNCTERKLAVEYGGYGGGRHELKFRNARFAVQFRQVNLERLV